MAREAITHEVRADQSARSEPRSPPDGPSLLDPPPSAAPPPPSGPAFKAAPRGGHAGGQKKLRQHLQQQDRHLRAAFPGERYLDAAALRAQAQAVLNPRGARQQWRHVAAEVRAGGADMPGDGPALRGLARRVRQQRATEGAPETRARREALVAGVLEDEMREVQRRVAERAQQAPREERGAEGERRGEDKDERRRARRKRLRASKAAQRGAVALASQGQDRGQVQESVDTQADRLNALKIGEE